MFSLGMLLARLSFEMRIVACLSQDSPFGRGSIGGDVDRQQLRCPFSIKRFQLATTLFAEWSQATACHSISHFGGSGIQREASVALVAELAVS